MTRNSRIEKIPEPARIEQFIAEPVNSAKVRQPLYEKRKKIFPKRATGQFRQFKWIVMLLTLGIYYITPWLRWDRGPYAPDQAVLLDIANRRFFVFFIEIWPQEFYYVAGLLVMAGFGLFLVTSAVGRAWCGYTCPQTVWVDLFLVVERGIEGDRNARIKLDQGPWTVEKLVKRITKHAVWLAIGAATGGAWIFYFADAPTLVRELIHGEAAPVAYITIAVLTATTYIFGGLMREQVCTYMCPWPRIQAAMLDEKSLVVTYNDWRGEPRGKHQKKAEVLSTGDCVDCNACVVVCPMGIDIRDGQQLECITCALCIDACDGVMDKLGRERGLIAYATLSDYDANMKLATNPETGNLDPAQVRNTDGTFKDTITHFDWRVIFRPRTLLYMFVWCAVGLGMLIVLMNRDRLELNVLHDRNPQYVLESDGSIRNGYTIHVLNMIPEKRTVKLALEGLPGGVMSTLDLTVPAGTDFHVPLAPDQTTDVKVYVTLPKDKTEEDNLHFKFVVTDPTKGESDSYNATFYTPEED